MEQIFSLDTLKLLVAFLSLVFGIWQFLQKRGIKKLIAFEAIELHKNVAFALGATQAAKGAMINGQSPSNEIGRAEGLCQAILFESAKLYCNLKNTKTDDIDDLIANGQLAESYRHIYTSFSDKPRGWFTGLLKKTTKVF
jgi:hypothetical protein